MEYREIKDLCKYSGQGKCPINFCSCNAEYCPLIPDLSDCERYCDKVKDLKDTIKILNYKFMQEKTRCGVYESQIFRQKFFEDTTCITEQWLLNAKFKKEGYNKYHNNNIVIYHYDNDPTEWQIFLRQGKNVNKYIAKTVGEFRQFLHLNNENYII